MDSFSCICFSRVYLCFHCHGAGADRYAHHVVCGSSPRHFGLYPDIREIQGASHGRGGRGPGGHHRIRRHPHGLFHSPRLSPLFPKYYGVPTCLAAQVDSAQGVFQARLAPKSEGLADEYPVLRHRSVGRLVGNPVHCFTHRGISDTSLGYPCHILGDSQRHHHSHGGCPWPERSCQYVVYPKRRFSAFPFVYIATGRIVEVILALGSHAVHWLRIGGEVLMPFAAPLLLFVAFFLLVDGLHLVLDHALAGLADMKVPALITTVCYWGIGLPAGITFGFVLEFGVLGLWWGLTLGVIAAVTFDLLRFRWVVHKFQACINNS